MKMVKHLEEKAANSKGIFSGKRNNQIRVRFGCSPQTKYIYNHWTVQGEKLMNISYLIRDTTIFELTLRS